MCGERLHPAVERLARDHDVEGCLRLLSDELSPADVTALMLEVAKRRARAVSPAGVLRQYGRDRFVRPAQVDVRRLVEVQNRALEAVDPRFEPVVLSPLVPFGTSAALSHVHQNRMVTTTRNTEVLSDPTTALALEAALRRRESRSTADGGDAVVRLACVDRVVRAQRFDGPRSFAHFSLLGLVSAGRDVGSHIFEHRAVREHLVALAAATAAVGLESVSVRLTDFGAHHDDVVEQLCQEPPTNTVVVTRAPDRTTGRGHYPTICFTLSAKIRGEEVELGDGGLVDWTQALVGSKKERLMTSGLSLERLAAVTT
ncbi:MAG TPA: hypothetical protein VHI95_07600 [Acidimicrobiales bacterium]|nr:hypothetical protein [Acidimicrobiales bacterium]